MAENEYDDLVNDQGSELLTLQKLDDECIKLQQEGKYANALEIMEKGLVLRQHFFGPNSEQVWNACKTVGEMCNLLAMTYLQQEDLPTVLELLKKAEILTAKDLHGRAVTHNNLACYHRRRGNLHAALSNLTLALKIEDKLEQVPNRADTHLNMCAVLSQLGKHQGTLEHAQSALILLHEELFAGKTAADQLEEKADRIAVLAIAYHNVGVEQEFIKKTELSIQSYQKGVQIAEKYLGSTHGIVLTLKKSLLAAKLTCKQTKDQLVSSMVSSTKRKTSSKTTLTKSRS